MAQYGYMNRGYIAQENSKPGTRIQPWDRSYNEVEPRSDQWSRTSIVTNREGLPDYRHSPDSTIVACTPDENTKFVVTRRERIVEHVHVPLVTGYKDSSPTRGAPLVTRYKYSSPPRVVPLDTRYIESSPPRVAPLVTRYIESCPPRLAPLVTRYVERSPPRVAPLVTRYKDSSPPRVTPLVNRYKDSSPPRVAPLVTKYQNSSPPRFAPSVTKYQNSSATKGGPTKENGTINKEWSKPVNPSHERPPIVDDFIGKVQTEASRPTRMGPLNGAFWRRTPNPPNYGGTNGHSDPQKNYGTVPNGTQEPTVITTGGWTRPSRAGWATPPSHDNALGKPTNDIGTIVDYINEATKPPSDKTFTDYRFTVPPPAVPRINSSTPTIDAKEAARRYKGTMLNPDASTIAQAPPTNAFGY
ncbi:hypothetical protein NE237_014463 [Protea cynaroides]|uniref:Uncharacterized protein n=1 Tax=Protea cynaroides TaxID=273540 RepID=A0A9Q0KC55_9MAGN|nr:hypothetical protein NE237_014463 [Protea cynaroides]